MATEHGDAFWLHAQRQVSIIELAECCGLSESDLRELVEIGALSPADVEAVEWTFSADCVMRVRRAVRLQRELELDPPMLSVLLAFLERIDALEERVRELSAQLQSPV